MADVGDPTMEAKWTVPLSFFGAVLAAVIAAAGGSSPAGAAEVVAHQLVADVWISEQVTPQQVPALKAQGFRTIIDLRPDGEGADQPAASEVSAAATANGMDFRYVPVANGEIPASAVGTLEAHLSKVERPVLIYCRSGRRAARSWALAEASRATGLGAAAITSAVQSAGQDAGDLRGEIEARIRDRKTSP